MSQILQLIIRVSGFWLVVNLTHVLLTKLLGEKYNFYLSRNGVFVKFVQLQWHTKRFNSMLSHGFVRSCNSKIALWFSCGAYFGILAMFSSVLILIYTLISSFVKDSDDDSSKILTPVVPGVNLPNSQIVPYLFTLLVSGIFHEYGHALAAAREGVSMYGAGLFMFLIYPAAFVDLNTEALKRCDAFQRLRIFCAGVWHNCVMMVGAYIVWNALPFALFFLGYTKEHAVTVTHVEAGSALANQVYSTTKLYSVNDCIIIDKISWGQCLWKMYDGNAKGNCVDDTILSELKSNTDCCKEGVVSPKSICFDSSGGAVCLHARQVLHQFTCETDTDCRTGYCYRPHPTEGHLLQILHSASDTKALFIGDPAHLYHTIDVSDYSSKFFWAHLPNCIEMFMIYIVSLSGALAIFNAVPAFYLDGQHMLDAFLELVLGEAGAGRVKSRAMISFIIQLFSTALIAINIVIAFISVCVMYQ